VGWRQLGFFLFQFPFYYIEYALSLLGAYDLLRQSMVDHAGTLRRYLDALALGNTLPLPELYRAAGTRLAFDRQTVREIARFMAELV